MEAASEVDDHLTVHDVTFNVDGTIVFRDASQRVVRAYASGAWQEVHSE
jgi:hypothetical protein